MKRPSVMQFRMREELKEGMEMLFEGDTFSNGLEKIAMYYLDDNIRKYLKQYKESKDVLKLYQAAGDFKGEIVRLLEKQIADLDTTLNHYVIIKNKCFPVIGDMTKIVDDTPPLNLKQG